MRLYFFILIILSAFILLFHLGTRPLLSSGEARASEIALEMMQTGNFFVPRLNEEIILTKPPLFHWLIILSYKVFGVSEFSSRFISATAGILVIIFTCLLAKRIWGEKIAFIAGLLLLTSPLFFWSARCARIDSLLLLFITVSMYCLWRGYEKLPAGGQGWFFGMFLFMGLGAMAKGPVAIIAPLLTLILFLLFINKRQCLAEVGWLKGLFVLILVIAPWFAAVYFLVPENKAELFYIQQNKAWLEGGSTGEWYKGYVYIPHLILGFLPWSLALPAVFLSTWRNFRNKKDDKIVFLWVWFIVVFSIFFFFGKKVSRYILPCYPALAILTASVISDKKNYYRKFIYILLGLWIFGIFALWLFGFYSHFLDIELVMLITKYISKILFTAVGLLVIALGIFGVKKNSLMYTVGIILLSLVMFILYFIPIESDYYSPRPFCEMLKKEVKQNEEVRAYKSWDNTIRYYFGRHVVVMQKEEELEDFLKSETKVYCFMWQKVYDRLPEKIKNQVYIIKGGYKVLETKVILVSNKKYEG